MELYAVLLVTRNNIYSEKAIDCLLKSKTKKGIIKSISIPRKLYELMSHKIPKKDNLASTDNKLLDNLKQNIPKLIDYINNQNLNDYIKMVVDFSFEKTAPNHSVLVLPVWHPVIKQLEDLDSIPSGMVLGFDGDTLETGDKVGVFYLDKQNNFKCAGSLDWKSNDFNETYLLES